MSAGLAAGNLAMYCLQVGLLIGFAACVPFLLRMKIPGAKLLYLQFVLIACLLLPVMRPWKQDVTAGAIRITTGVAVEAPSHEAPRVHLPVTEIVLWVLAAGVVARLGWLLTGLRRLRRYRLYSRQLEPAPSWSAEADLRISDEVSSPVTFGFMRPVVLLPARFPELDETVRDAILCHEVLHVRRHDWLVTVAEELVRAVLWFHPAIWWLLGEIQLAREQAVDREAIDTIKSRDQYVDALLTIAGTPARLDLAPAPLFLRKRHLKQRVVSIFKEVRMSKRRSVSAFAAGVGMLAATCWFVTGALPLSAAPEIVSDAAGVAVEMNGAQLMHRMPVAYPRNAMTKGIQGTVVAQLKLDASGNVSDASIVSGPEELRKAVLQSVLNWHFTKDAALGTRQVSVIFTAPNDAAAQKDAQTVGQPVAGAIAKLSTTGPAMVGVSTLPIPQTVSMQPANRTIRSIEVHGLSDDATAEVTAQLPIRQGDTLTPELMAKTVQVARAFDEHLTVTSMPVSPSETIVTLWANGGAMPFPMMQPPPPPTGMSFTPSAGQKIRVGGNVQQMNLVQKVNPAYPPLAKSARVQGTVTFEATIGKDGHILNLELVSGHPILVQAAMDAVRQWVYKPTLLNGNPVDVITTIEVNFTLSQ